MYEALYVKYPILLYKISTLKLDFNGQSSVLWCEIKF